MVLCVGDETGFVVGMWGGPQITWRGKVL